MIRLTAAVLMYSAFSGCVPLLELGGKVALDSAFYAATASHQAAEPAEDDDEELAVNEVDRLMERSRLRLAIKYDAVEAPPCRVSSHRTGKYTWRLDSCDGHLDCHQVGRNDFSCPVPPAIAPASTQL